MEKPAPGSADEGADIKLTMPSKKIAIAFKEDKDEWLKLMCAAPPPRPPSGQTA